MDHDRIDNTHVPFIKSAMRKVELTSPKVLDPAVVKLRQWLINQQMTVPQLAMRTGFTPQTYYNMLSGQPWSYPSLAQAFSIEYATKGYVKAYEWLENKYIEQANRESLVKRATRFEGQIKSLVLKYMKLTTIEGVIRHRARILSRLFGVEWGEVKRRMWEDAKLKAKEEVADISHLLYDITEEEHNAQNQDED